MRGRGGLVTAALVGALALAAAGCGGDDGGGTAGATTAAPETTAAPGTTAGGEDELKLTAQGFAWSQTSLQMQAGSEVTVEVSNRDSTTHSFTFPDAGADQDIPAGEDATVAFTAPAAGSHQFRCKYHGSMTGTVTVT
jgi:plastocyanin